LIDATLDATVAAEITNFNIRDMYYDEITNGKIDTTSGDSIRQVSFFENWRKILKKTIFYAKIFLPQKILIF